MPARYKSSRPRSSVRVRVCDDGKTDVTDWRSDELVEDGDVNIPKTGTSDSLIERLDEPDRDDTGNTNDAGRGSDSFDDREMASALKLVWKRMQRASRRETQQYKEKQGLYNRAYYQENKKKIAARRKRNITTCPNVNHCYIQTPIYCKHGKSIYTEECGRCR